MKRLAAIALAAIAFAGPAAAEPRWKQYRAVAVSFPQRSNDPALTVFRAILSEIAQKKDAEGLQKHVARDFFWERDLGGGFDKTRSGFINLTTALDLATESGIGWRTLGAFAEQLTGPHAEKKGVFCGPPAPKYDEQAFEVLVSRTASDVFDWSYPAHAHVIVREKGEHGSKEAGKLSMHFVYTGLSIRPENFDPFKDWTPVILRDGKRGFVAPGELLTLLDPRLCFVKRDGGWLIAGYIGGGD